MTWQNEMTRIVRHLVNDLDCDTYTDDRIEETIIVSAQLIIDRVQLDTAYNIDVDSLTLSPDPTQLTPKDYDFINIVSMKTACILLSSEAKTLAAQAYRITDGPSTIDIKGAFDAVKSLRDQLCEAVEEAILQFNLGNSKAGQAILTPYTQTWLGTGIYNIF